MNAIEAIEQLFIGAWAHTVTLEYMEGEEEILVSIESLDGTIAQGTCDWGADENLGDEIVHIANLAMRP